jgi:D-glycero-D-manno-heptose 1,7-bisphosphate phosphatase
MLDLKQINNSWTLFLDRDGVINKDKSPYTLNADEFEFYEGVPDAIKTFTGIFHRIFVVTNQRGIGRGMMTENDLKTIHEKMIKGINEAGGKIDKIYYCPANDSSHPDRKPNPGMALKAMKDFPDVKPESSIMVGNNISDMQFGRNAGFYTVLLHTTGTKTTPPHPLVDMQYNTLQEFAEALVNVLH